MKLDSEQQRALLLELIAAAHIPGKGLDLVYQLKQAIIAAQIEVDS